MKPTLQFKLSQHLTLTPQLQQSIRLLQLSTVELSQEIERIAQENPLLELDDTPANDVSDYRNGAVHNDLEPLTADSIEIPEEGERPLPSILIPISKRMQVMSRTGSGTMGHPATGGMTRTSVTFRNRRQSRPIYVNILTCSSALARFRSATDELLVY